MYLLSHGCGPTPQTPQATTSHLWEIPVVCLSHAGLSRTPAATSSVVDTLLSFALNVVFGSLLLSSWPVASYAKLPNPVMSLSTFICDLSILGTSSQVTQRAWPSILSLRKSPRGVPGFSTREVPYTWFSRKFFALMHGEEVDA